MTGQCAALGGCVWSTVRSVRSVWGGGSDWMTWDSLSTRLAVILVLLTLHFYTTSLHHNTTPTPLLHHNTTPTPLLHHNTTQTPVKALLDQNILTITQDLTSRDLRRACGEFPSGQGHASLAKQDAWSRCWSAGLRSMSDSMVLAVSMQDMLQDILTAILEGRTKVILLDVANFENKGDPGMGLGELSLLSQLGLQLLFYCDYSCEPQHEWRVAQSLVDKHGPHNVVLLAHGGGNIGAYPERDIKRFEMMEMFPDVRMIIMSQSVFFADPSHLALATDKYSSHPHLTMLLRNQYSHSFIRDHMPGVNALLAPDVAYGIEPVQRFMAPLYDILFIHRTDREAVHLGNFTFPPGVTYSTLDWHQPWPTPQGKHFLEQLHLLTSNGLMFLQRGRVLITDRLHGFIFSTLLREQYPVVLLDNKLHKLEDFYQTWAAGLSHVRLAYSAQEAVDKAFSLLTHYYPQSR